MSDEEQQEANGGTGIYRDQRFSSTFFRLRVPFPGFRLHSGFRAHPAMPSRGAILLASFARSTSVGAARWTDGGVLDP